MLLERLARIRFPDALNKPRPRPTPNTLGLAHRTLTWRHFHARGRGHFTLISARPNHHRIIKTLMAPGQKRHRTRRPSGHALCAAECSAYGSRTWMHGASLHKPRTRSSDRSKPRAHRTHAHTLTHGRFRFVCLRGCKSSLASFFRYCFVELSYVPSMHSIPTCMYVRQSVKA